MSWVTVTKIDDLIDQPKVLVEVQGKSLGILRDENRLSAALNECPHKVPPFVREESKDVLSRGPIV